MNPADASDGTQAVFVSSEALPDGTPIVEGFDFNTGRDLDGIMSSMLTSGFQATHLGQAVKIVNEMISCRQEEGEAAADDSCGSESEATKQQKRCKIFLGFTSNLISSGVRESIRFLCQHRLIDVICTTAGGVEEDFIKCMAPTYVGDFTLQGSELRKKGQNRIGNMVLPNSNYCKFEDFMTPILDALLYEQESLGINWTPSKIIARLGERIADERSVYYWAWKNKIPVYCPALTDGSIGDMMFFHSVHKPGLRCDIIEDIRAMNNEALHATGKTGCILLGGGVPKHHILNANLMRNGADFCVLLNTAQEFDGSDSGARPDEAVSWGKLRLDAKSAKVCIDATIGFPLLMSQTFARHGMTTG